MELGQGHGWVVGILGQTGTAKPLSGYGVQNKLTCGALNVPILSPSPELDSVGLACAMGQGFQQPVYV